MIVEVPHSKGQGSGVTRYACQRDNLIRCTVEEEIFVAKIRGVELRYQVALQPVRVCTMNSNDIETDTDGKVDYDYNYEIR